MDVVDDQRDGPEAQRVGDLMPQVPVVGVLRRVEPNDRTAGLWCPLLQERGLAIAGRSGNERNGLRSASASLQKSSASDDAVLRDCDPSVGRPFA
jgi:hypothetical protein